MTVCCDGKLNLYVTVFPPACGIVISFCMVLCCFRIVLELLIIIGELSWTKGAAVGVVVTLQSVLLALLISIEDFNLTKGLVVEVDAILLSVLLFDFVLDNLSFSLIFECMLLEAETALRQSSKQSRASSKTDESPLDAVSFLLSFKNSSFIAVEFTSLTDSIMVSE